MEKTFVIAWRSKSEARWGQGRKLFTREEAEALAEEMNREYPAFLHEPLNVVTGETSATPASEPAILHVEFRSAPELAVPVREEAEEAVMA